MRRNLFWLSDEQWARIEPHLPTDVRGVERVDDRRVISGIEAALAHRKCIQQAQGLQAYRNSLRQVGAKLSRLCLPRRCLSYQSALAAHPIKEQRVTGVTKSRPTL